MLKIHDDALHIELNGKHSDPLFWWSLLLLMLGVLVAVICFILPTTYAVGALFVFAVAVFFFNIKKQQAKSCRKLSVGTLIVKPSFFDMKELPMPVRLGEQASIQNEQGVLIIKDGGREYRLSGFENDQEIHIVQAVLQGRGIATRHANIRMNDGKLSSH